MTLDEQFFISGWSDAFALEYLGLKNEVMRLFLNGALFMAAVSRQSQ